MEGARQADRGDLDAVSRLWRDAVAELDGQRGGPLLAGTLTHPDLASFLREGMQDPERLLVLGHIDDYAVGVASAVCERDRREPLAHIELVFVEANARQIGVAGSMMEAVYDWAMAKGCVGIDAPALPGNRAAKAFFEGQGFLARLLVMHQPLRRGDG